MNALTLIAVGVSIVNVAVWRHYAPAIAVSVVLSMLGLIILGSTQGVDDLLKILGELGGVVLVILPLVVRIVVWISAQRKPLP